MFGVFFDDPYQIREEIVDFTNTITMSDTTTLMSTEVPVGSNKLSRFEMEEFASDGVIVLHYIRDKDTYVRAISVRKMRNSDHSDTMHPLRITKNGLIVFPEHKVFSDSVDKQ